MKYQLLMRAYDRHGDVLSESTVPSVSLSRANEHLEHFVGRLERLKVPFVRVTHDLAAERPVRFVSLFEEIERDMKIGDHPFYFPN